MLSDTQPTPIIIRRNQLEGLIGLSRSHIYAKVSFNAKRPQDYDPTFPKPISLGNKAVGFLLAEVQAWIELQAEKRNSSQIPKNE